MTQPSNYTLEEFTAHWTRYLVGDQPGDDDIYDRMRDGFNAEYPDPEEADRKCAVFQRAVRFYVANASSLDEGNLSVVGEHTLIAGRLLRALHHAFTTKGDGYFTIEEIKRSANLPAQP